MAKVTPEFSSLFVKIEVICMTLRMGDHASCPDCAGTNRRPIPWAEVMQHG